MSEPDVPVLARFSLAGKVALVTGASSGASAGRPLRDGPGQLARLAAVDVHVAVDAAVQAEEPQARVLRGRRGAGERGHAAPVQRDQVPGQRLDPGPVAGRADDNVGSADGAVGEDEP